MVKGKLENPFDLNTKPFEEWNDMSNIINPSGSFEGKGGKYLRVKSDETGTEWASGGGSGTDDYNELSNKPKIAGVTLVGDKSLADLGIASTTELAGKIDKDPNSIPAKLGVGSDGRIYAEFEI